MFEGKENHVYIAGFLPILKSVLFQEYYPRGLPYGGQLFNLARLCMDTKYGSAVLWLVTRTKWVDVLSNCIAGTLIGGNLNHPITFRSQLGKALH